MISHLVLAVCSSLVTLTHGSGEHHHHPTHFNFLDKVRQSFSFECPPGQAVVGFGTQFTDGKCDRQWAFECRKVPGVLGPDHCRVLDFANGPHTDHIHEYFNFVCPNNGVITGIVNEHVDPSNDRRWRYRCCDTVVSLNKEPHHEHHEDIGAQEYGIPDFGHGGGHGFGGPSFGGPGFGGPGFGGPGFGGPGFGDHGTGGFADIGLEAALFGRGPSDNKEENIFTDCKDFPLSPQFRGANNVRIPKGFACTSWRAFSYFPEKEDRYHSVSCCKISTCKGCRQYTLFDFPSGGHGGGFPGHGGHGGPRLGGW